MSSKFREFLKKKAESSLYEPDNDYQISSVENFFPLVGRELIKDDIAPKTIAFFMVSAAHEILCKSKEFSPKEADDLILEMAMRARVTDESDQ